MLTLNFKNFVNFEIFDNLVDDVIFDVISLDFKLKRHQYNKSNDKFFCLSINQLHTKFILKSTMLIVYITELDDKINKNLKIFSMKGNKIELFS